MLQALELGTGSADLESHDALHVKEQLSIYSPTTSFYDAPVSGGVIGAANATMAFFLGCSLLAGP
ncbi:hypothetical protein QBC33DRAFT_603806 [Phialemonium atrogriseum]|uniref:6-phosphogluconate dehydrogenase NADP-binding domain-containing protein n=1 Tax=Phialemonium atrogriseum TaxID=1093897 RepID=A0AAJ0BTK9_9PEZI|nr:uncharacterized protein QBC33DRAFT_603806 [Phialemonium atrogriseum]KAK1761796.1 hypothetical protein QBC33DRAFT_603806 [Phialemonium atrogriseum]